MDIEFTNHNIRLDDGTFTKPEMGQSMESYAWFVSARRILETVFPGDRQKVRLVDLGCLEGGYAVEFARMGFQVLGIEVRDSNMAACNYVKSKTNLPNLEFIQDNVLNLSRYGVFDVAFCSGLLYHFDKPKQFLEILSAAITKLVILQTHFSTDATFEESQPPSWTQKLFQKAKVEDHVPNKFNLSPLSENEGLMGRWFTEFPNEQSFSEREANKWASWDNRRSFWIQREYLLQAIQGVGFDLVLEQFDSLAPNIAENMLRGYYLTDSRGTFIGIKTQNSLTS
jgi:2-polyprenyl-3-methyl-5-hydroxy-6-metoxy-1,4-benzoquinol methylase